MFSENNTTELHEAKRTNSNIGLTFLMLRVKQQQLKTRPLITTDYNGAEHIAAMEMQSEGTWLNLSPVTTPSVSVVVLLLLFLILLLLLQY